MKSTIAIYLFILMVATSCSTVNKGFIAKHKKKKIHLTEFSESTIKIGYETDLAITYFRKNDILNLVDRKLNGREINQRRDYQLINDLKKTSETIANLESDKIIKHWFGAETPFDSTAYFLAGEIDGNIYRNLILEGKAMVFNKSEKVYEKIIYYHFVRDRLGGEDCYYTFENRVEFHRQLIALGE